MNVDEAGAPPASDPFADSVASQAQAPSPADTLMPPAGFQAAVAPALDADLGPVLTEGDFSQLWGQYAADRSRSNQAVAYGGSHPDKTTGGIAARVIDEAMKYLGTNYVWGGDNPKTGFDCSGLVQWAFAQVGIKLPRVAFQQAAAGQQVSASQAQAGDLVWFNENNQPGADHIAIYLGNGKYLEAPHTGAQVRISDIGKQQAYFTRIL